MANDKPLKIMTARIPRDMYDRICGATHNHYALTKQSLSVQKGMLMLIEKGLKAWEEDFRAWQETQKAGAVQ